VHQSSLETFLVRVAGNTANAPALLGSVEYAAASVLLMVLGPRGLRGGQGDDRSRPDGHTGAGPHRGFVDPIIPAVQAVQGQPADQLMDAAVQQNVRLQVQQLSASTPLLAPLFSSGKLKVVGAEYHLASGQVQLVS
jgi:carbonic anhydrase